MQINHSVVFALWQAIQFSCVHTLNVASAMIDPLAFDQRETEQPASQQGTLLEHHLFSWVRTYKAMKQDKRLWILKFVNTRMNTDAWIKSICKPPDQKELILCFKKVFFQR